MAIGNTLTFENTKKDNKNLAEKCKLNDKTQEKTCVEFVIDDLQTVNYKAKTLAILVSCHCYYFVVMSRAHDWAGPTDTVKLNKWFMTALKGDKIKFGQIYLYILNINTMFKKEKEIMFIFNSL